MISLRFPQQKNLFDFIKLIIVFLFPIDYYINIKFLRSWKFMGIRIRNKHTGKEFDLFGVAEFFCNSDFIFVVRDSTYDPSSTLSYKKRDYELVFIF